MDIRPETTKGRFIWVGTCGRCDEDTLCEKGPETDEYGRDVDRDEYCSVCGSPVMDWRESWIPDIGASTTSS